MANFKPAVGVYAMHHMHNGKTGNLVLISSETRPGFFGIEYVPCGGASYSWPAEEFRPVTDAALYAKARVHAINRELGTIDGRKISLCLERAKWEGAIDALNAIASASGENIP